MKKQSSPKKILDCVIIGAGPAGISVALYLQRFLRSYVLVDGGDSRMLMIAKTHNYPGFAQGISGRELLKILKGQLYQYNPCITKDVIKQVERDDDGIFVTNNTFYSKTILLATGVEDVWPTFSNTEKAIKKSLIRFCPVCDAYEVRDKRIGILGNESGAINEALFLKRYSSFISLLTEGKPLTCSSKELEQAKKEQINLLKQPVASLSSDKDHILVEYNDGTTHQFDTLYAALGCKKRNKLALDLGVEHKEGDILVDPFQKTSLKGVYAAGDIVSGLNQICVAQGQGAIAASAIHQYCLELEDT